MRLLWFNIQDPIDPQVNGFGFYRTVVDGTVPLLVAKKQMPDSPEYSVTHPWEASDATNESLILLFGIATQNITTVTGANPSPTISTSPWETEPYNHANAENYANPLRATYPWEIADQELTQSRMTWAFSSTMEDDALGAEVEYDNNLPVGNHLTAIYQEHVFTAGDPDNPHYLYHSKRFRPESFPTDNFIEIGTANDPATALATIAGIMGMFTVETKYRITGNAESGFVHFEAISRRGTRSPKAAVPSDKGIIFVATDGVFTTNLIGPDSKISGKIEALFSEEDINGEEHINFAQAHQISGAYFKSKYYMTYCAGEATTPNRMAVFGFDNEEWAIYDHEGGALLVEADVDYLTMGGVDGYLYRIEDGVVDDTSAISTEFRSKEFAGGSYNSRNLFLYYKVDAKLPDGYALNTHFYIDDELIRDVEITGERTNILNHLPEGSFGTRWRVTCDIDDDKGETEIYGCAAVFIPLNAS